MRYFNSAFFSVVILFLTVFSAFAQETELKVIDEVVAQVNDSVVTLSGVKREMKDAIASLVEQGKTKEQAETQINSRQGELIANIIIEELILQKGKELGLDADVEAEVNQRFLQKMKELNLKSLDKLYEAMRGSGVEPDQIRAVWRKQLIRDFVLQREVDSMLYMSWTSKDIKDYY